MIIEVDVNLEDLRTQQRSYLWPSPDPCPKCQCKLWGHGYSWRFFNQLKNVAVPIKRWSCPRCPIIFTARPKSHWRRFHESISNIYLAVSERIITLKWPPWASRQRAGHWLKKLMIKAKLHLLEKESAIKTILFFQQKGLTIF